MNKAAQNLDRLKVDGSNSDNSTTNSSSATRHPKKLTLVWVALIGLTLFSALFAERTQLTGLTIVFICSAVAIKGALVIDTLMGLRNVSPTIRWMMLSYFIVLPPIISLVMIFPQTLARLTSF